MPQGVADDLCYIKLRNSGNETALGKDDIRLELFDQLLGLPIALQHTERIRKILYIKIAAQLPGGNRIVGDALFFDQIALNTFVGADIRYVKVCFSQRRKQGDIRSHMTCSAAAC